MGKVLSKKHHKVTEIELSDYQNEVLYKCYRHLSYHTNGLQQEGVAVSCFNISFLQTAKLCNCLESPVAIH